MSQTLVADGIVSWDAERPQLVGSRCTACATVTFPRQGSCPCCAGEEMADHRLATRGRLWAWTTQEFPPPSPPYTGPTGADFVPFAVGYVDLGEVKVESRLTESDPAALSIGMDLELVVVPFRTTGEGENVMTFAFQPVG